MTGDVDRDRLKRLRGDLADLRARALAGQGEPADPEEAAATPVATQPPQADQPRIDQPAADSADANRPSADRPRDVPLEAGTVLTPVASGPVREDPDGQERRAEEDESGGAGVATRPPGRSAAGRKGRPPRPPRRNPFRRKAHRPPDRLAVPAPIPVTRRSVWSAAPRWPTIDWVSGPVIALVLVPAVGQLVFRLWTAITTTSVLAGADPSRADYLQAAAGVAGGGITTALAVAALAIVRGRVGYLAGAAATLLMFGLFPYMAYTANGGIVSAPLPSLAEMVAPVGWPRGEQLGAVFLVSAAALAAALIDLLYRGALAVREGINETRR